MKTGIFVCGRDINLPLPEWKRLMWGEPPDKMGSLPMAIKIALDEGLENIRLIILGNGCIPRKNQPSKIGFTRRYFLEELGDLDVKGFDGLKGYDIASFRSNITSIIGLMEIDRIVENTAEEITRAAQVFEETNVKKVFMVSCGSQIARATMAFLQLREAGDILKNQQWFFVADDMTYYGTTAANVVVVEPPHRTDDPSLHAPIKMHEVMKRFFRIPWGKRVELLQQFDATLKTFEEQTEPSQESPWTRCLGLVLGKSSHGQDPP